MRVFETEDMFGRLIYLSDERWKHINEEHPEVSEYIRQFDDVLKNPTKIVPFAYDKDIFYYYKYFKLRQFRTRYLLLIVKYLNGEGFIITAYFVRNIQ